MRHPEPLPPIQRSAAFSVMAATAAGVSSPRLRRSDLLAPFHGSRVPVVDFDGGFRSRCVAYRAIMKPSQCFSHVTAALIYGLSVPWRVQQSADLHVAALNGGRAPRGKGVVGHKSSLGAEMVQVHRGMRVPRVEQVLCQLAAMLTVEELIVAGDSCVRRKNPLSSVARLAAAAQIARNRPGAGELRAALARVREDTDSAMETLLRLRLIDAGLPEPVVNRPIPIGSGIELHGDLVYVERQIVVEYDGDHHRTMELQYHRDIDRIWALEAAGWRVIRINRSHLENGAALAVARVRAALADRGRNSP
ncbi:endonuclease domain-containing protein [Leifsonia sp. Leaf336]|uniref:endonuclease domain-containing protein n=1 Tax=Leifsonia sp. Leaf336 TaxID=1736341 RepID=UPI0009E6CFBD|nr:DUF559 domain-containing protein [Leifsonia sp. Leaf336]